MTFNSLIKENCTKKGIITLTLRYAAAVSCYANVSTVSSHDDALNTADKNELISKTTLNTHFMRDTITTLRKPARLNVYKQSHLKGSSDAISASVSSRTEAMLARRITSNKHDFNHQYESGYVYSSLFGISTVS